MEPPESKRKAAGLSGVRRRTAPAAHADGGRQWAEILRGGPPGWQGSDRVFGGVASGQAHGCRARKISIASSRFATRSAGRPQFPPAGVAAGGVAAASPPEYWRVHTGPNPGTRRAPACGVALTEDGGVAQPIAPRRAGARANRPGPARGGDRWWGRKPMVTRRTQSTRGFRIGSKERGTPATSARAESASAIGGP